MSELFGGLEALSFCLLFLVCLWRLKDIWITGNGKAVLGLSGTAQAWLGWLGGLYLSRRIGWAHVYLVLCQDLRCFLSVSEAT